jgi:DNA modification methylase
VLSFPPHLVRDYLKRFGVRNGQTVLDPFCGTGTTLVECKKLGLTSVGLEANPMACFASQVKLDWEVDPARLGRHAASVAEAVEHTLKAEGLDEEMPLWHPGYRRHGFPSGLRKLPEEAEDLLLTGSISPVPLHKTLVLLDELKRRKDGRCTKHEKLALASALVTRIGNLQFGPEVGVGPAKTDAPVVAAWLANVRQMAEDLRFLQAFAHVPSVVHQTDARSPLEALKPNTVSAVFTSPPYPNEKDYTRTTRLESVLLDFIRNRAELQAFKRTLMRSNTRNVYKGDSDDEWVAEHPVIRRIAEEIEARRLALGKTSGFERLYAKVTKLYFGGMARHLAELRAVLRPGAQLAYVVGDQASYLRVMIRTGQLLADLAQALGYELVGIDLFRTRLATATKEQLREEVVLLRWPGRGSEVGEGRRSRKG